MKKRFAALESGPAMTETNNDTVATARTSSLYSAGARVCVSARMTRRLPIPVTTRPTEIHRKSPTTLFGRAASPRKAGPATGYPFFAIA